MSEKPEVFTIQAQIAAPSKRLRQGAVVMGCYIVDDGHVVMTDAQGEPITDKDHKEYRHKLAPGDNPKSIAARLVRRVRDKERGKRIVGFNGQPIVYPHTNKF
jgi:hypothetical protein